LPRGLKFYLGAFFICMRKNLDKDQYYIKKTFQLARKGAGYTSPNPLVGAILVNNDEVVGQGCHKNYGGPHAEIFALEQAGKEAKGATLYVNLEPCSHFGQTPPCVDRVIETGISKVVISNCDPNPLVNGSGIRKLKDAGIKVKLSVLEEEGLKLNEAYFTYVIQQRPFVILKWAQSIDGRIATKNYESSWISNEKSRKIVHEIRRDVDAVLVGVGTVNHDNPQLTVRHINGKQPWRLILDRELEITLNSQIILDKFAQQTVIFTTEKNQEKINKVQKNGVQVVVLETKSDQMISQILTWMAKRKMISLLVEGGGEVLTSFLKADLVDKLMVFVAPKLLGQGINAVGDLSVLSMNEIINLKNTKFQKVGSDMLIEAYLKD